MTQWQVTYRTTTETVEAERSLDAVAAFCKLHPETNGKHIYAKPLNGNDPAPQRAYNPARALAETSELTPAPTPAAAATVPPGPSAPVQAVTEGSDKHPPEQGTYKTRRAASVRANKKAEAAAAAAAERAARYQERVEAEAEEASKAQGAAPKAGGVIGALVALLSDGTKRTRAELYDALAAQFPDRASATGGMRNTIGVQLSALAKKGHKIQKTADGRYFIG